MASEGDVKPGVAARGKGMVAYGWIESEKIFMLGKAEMVSFC